MMADLLNFYILMMISFMINGEQYDQCGQVVKPSVQNRFAIDGDGARIVAPWIVALGVKKDGDKDGFDEFNVKCSGSILTKDIVIREAFVEQQVHKCFKSCLMPKKWFNLFHESFPSVQRIVLTKIQLEEALMLVI